MSDLLPGGPLNPLNLCRVKTKNNKQGKRCEIFLK